MRKSGHAGPKLPVEEWREETFPVDFNEPTREQQVRAKELKEYSSSDDPVDRFIGKVLAAPSEDSAFFYCPGAKPFLIGKSAEHQTKLQVSAFTAQSLWLPVVRAIRSAPDKDGRRAAVTEFFGKAVREADLDFQTDLMEQRLAQAREGRKAAKSNDNEDPFPEKFEHLDQH